MSVPSGAGGVDRAIAAAARVRVRLTPRGGRDAIDGVDDDGVLRVRVRAAPVEGAANRALLRLLAEELRVPLRSLEIEAGETSRVKQLRVEGVAVERLMARFPALALQPVGATDRS